MAAENKFNFDPEVPLQATMVPTAETTRVRFWMDMLMERRRPVMLIGNAGSGKTVLVQSKAGFRIDTLDDLAPSSHWLKLYVVRAPKISTIFGLQWLFDTCSK